MIFHQIGSEDQSRVCNKFAILSKRYDERQSCDTLIPTGCKYTSTNRELKNKVAMLLRRTMIRFHQQQLDIDS